MPLSSFRKQRKGTDRDGFDHEHEVRLSRISSVPLCVSLFPFSLLILVPSLLHLSSSDISLRNEFDQSNLLFHGLRGHGVVGGSRGGDGGIADVMRQQSFRTRSTEYKQYSFLFPSS